MAWGKGGKGDDEGAEIIPLPSKCPPHIWTPTYDEDGEIIGRICTKCGKIEGRLS